MSDSKCLNTLLLEVPISSQNECVYIRDLSDVILIITFDVQWTSINVGSTCSIAWNNSRDVPI